MLKPRISKPVKFRLPTSRGLAFQHSNKSFFLFSFDFPLLSETKEIWNTENSVLERGIVFNLVKMPVTAFASWQPKWQLLIDGYGGIYHEKKLS